MTHKISALIAALFLAAAPSTFAGEASVSQSLSLDLNSHFISYGADVWSAGDEWQDALFNPSSDITWDLGNGVSLYTGVWLDINSADEDTESGLGGDVQELDWWFGTSFGVTEDLTVDVIYQAWMFAEENEGIIDVVIAYDGEYVAPVLTIHNRVESNGTQETGTVLDLGLSHSIEVEGVNLSVPFNIAWASDEFHGGEDGFAYLSIGLDASVPLSFIPEELGAWDVHAGVKYWHTNDDVIPGNPEENFVTGNIGIGTSF